MIKIGVLGAGHLGKIHLKLLKEIDAFHLAGFYDADPAVGEKVSRTLGIKAFDSMAALLEAVEVVDIVTPTLSHFECAKQALEAGKHIFIEKPLTDTLDEAIELRKILKTHPQLRAQVGHVERFNPAFLSVADMELKPMFIEGHRLAVYNPRGTDVSVVLDLMIHDLDVILSLVDSPVREIRASGVAVISNTPDIANARIAFENGCVANLTASRISLKNMRRLRVFQKNSYVAVDFLKKKSEIFRLSEEDLSDKGGMQLELKSGTQTRYLLFEEPEVKEVNAIKMELEELAASIEQGAPIRVTVEDGYRALKIAHAILEKIEEHLAAAEV
jgi:predicted dehydrogenase